MSELVYMDMTSPLKMNCVRSFPILKGFLQLVLDFRGIHEENT